jgi:hypothetical protein
MKYLKICFGVLFLFFVSCSKDKQLPADSPAHAPDYRDKFTGSYHSHKLCINTSFFNPAPDTTFNNFTNINVVKHPLRSNAVIVGSDTINLSFHGTFTGLNNPPGYLFYDLTLINDSLYISSFSGNVLLTSSCILKGRKQ